MSDISSLHVEPPTSPRRNRSQPYRPPFLNKRLLSEEHNSSHGESEATPTPKPRKAQRLDPTPDINTDPSIPHSPPALMKVAQDNNMEDVEDESDDYYDQFDLGDFTKEEIKIYEAMVGPGERLRDAAPPVKSFAEVLESSCERCQALDGEVLLTVWADQASLIPTNQEPKIGAKVVRLPVELYPLVRAGVSNAIRRAIEDKDIMVDFDLLCSESLVDDFMDEISAPAPQIGQFLRTHELFRYKFRPPTLGSREADQRQYEQDVYDFSRDLGLPIEEAVAWVHIAKHICEYERSDIVEGNDVNDSGSKLNQSSRISSPEIFRLPENVVGQYAKVNKGEVAVQGKQEAVPKGKKKRRKGKPKAEKGASRQLDQKESLTGEYKHADESEEQVIVTTISKDLLQLEQLKDKENIRLQKKKGRKRKRKHDSMPQCGLQLEEEYEHEKSRAYSDPQEGIPSEVKRKKAKLQVSPFFQRSSGPKAKKKDASKKAKKQMDFQPPMIQ